MSVRFCEACQELTYAAQCQCGAVTYAVEGETAISCPRCGSLNCAITIQSSRLRQEWMGSTFVIVVPGPAVKNVTIACLTCNYSYSPGEA